MLIHDSPTAHLAYLALQLFGEEWAGSLSRFTGISLRNCQRARAAAEAKEEERRAPAILEALISRLESLTPLLQDAFNDLKKAPNPFSAKALPKHAGVDLTMAETARQRLYELLHRAATYRDDWVDENLLLLLAYDLRKARDRLYYLTYEDPDAPPPETVTVRALWPLLLFQLKMLRTTCGHIATGPAEIALMDDLEAEVFAALKRAYPKANMADDVVMAWHEMGLDPHSAIIDDLALSRAAWFLDAKTPRRRSALAHLLQSVSDLYASLDGEVDDGRPTNLELDAWIEVWPEIDF